VSFIDFVQCAVWYFRLLFFAAGSSAGVAYTGARDLKSLESFVQSKLDIAVPDVRMSAVRVFVFSYMLL